MDAYGSIEPIQLDQMEAVFEELQKDKKVQVAGTHIALISAYGGVANDFDKTISVFDSIRQTPGVPPPDVVVFEVVINVLVRTNRRIFCRCMCQRWWRRVCHYPYDCIHCEFLDQGVCECG